MTGLREPGVCGPFWVQERYIDIKKTADREQATGHDDLEVEGNDDDIGD